METFLLSRVGKPILMFIITFFSVKYLTGSIADGFLMGLIPALLGAINISAAAGYSLTAVILISSVVWAVTPVMVKAPLAQMASQAFQETLHGVAAAKPSPQAQPKAN